MKPKLTHEQHVDMAKRWIEFEQNVLEPIEQRLREGLTTEDEANREAAAAFSELVQRTRPN